MDSEKIVDAIDAQKWLIPVDKTLQEAADATLNQGGASGQTIRNWLHGIWLGHPLHPVLTDLPIGAWTISALCDAVGALSDEEERAALEKSSQALTAIGLVGALGSAVTGLNDWQHTHNTPRRVGTLHAVLNIGATILYAASLIMRRRGATTSGKVTGLAGYGLMAAASYLGGTLVYDEKIGVDHAPLRGELPQDWTPILDNSALQEGEMQRVEVEGNTAPVSVLLARRDGEIYAIANACSHLGGPLCEGKIAGLSVVCPWHDSQFSLQDGSVLNGPAAFAQPTFETRVQGGKIEIKTTHPIPDDVANKQDWETV